MKESTREEGEITEDDEVSSSIDAISELDDSDYRDMLLEYYEAKYNVQSKTKCHQKRWHMETVSNRITHLVAGNIFKKQHEYINSSLQKITYKKDSVEDDLYELELRRDALASVPIDLDYIVMSSAAKSSGSCQGMQWHNVSNDPTRLQFSASNAAQPFSKREEFCQFMQDTQNVVTDIEKLPVASCPCEDKWACCNLQSTTPEISLSVCHLSDALIEPHFSSAVPYTERFCNLIIDQCSNNNLMYSLDSTSRGLDIDVNMSPITSTCALEQSDNAQQKSINDQDGMEEIEALLLRDQLLHSMTIQHQKPAVSSRVVQIPKHKPVVITLSDDATDSDNDGNFHYYVDKSSSHVGNAENTVLPRSFDSVLHAVHKATKIITVKNGCEVTSNTSTPASEVNNGYSFCREKLSRRLLPVADNARQCSRALRWRKTSKSSSKCLNECKMTIKANYFKQPSAQLTNKIVCSQMTLIHLLKKLNLHRRQLELHENAVVALHDKIKNKINELQTTEIQIINLQQQLVVAKKCRSSTVKELSVLNAKKIITCKNTVASRNCIRNVENQIFHLRRTLGCNTKYTMSATHVNKTLLPADAAMAGKYQANLTKSDNCCAAFTNSYKSSLRCLKAFRFSSYFHLKEGLSLSSVTFSNKLDFRKPLCRFELLGKCFDDHCPWQHLSDYVMTHRELLMDLASYHLCVAGISYCTPVNDYPKIIGNYIDGFIGRHSASTNSYQCWILLCQICEAAGRAPPHMLFIDSGRWEISALSSGRRYIGNFPIPESTSINFCFQENVIC